MNIRRIIIYILFANESIFLLFLITIYFISCEMYGNTQNNALIFCVFGYIDGYKLINYKNVKNKIPQLKYLLIVIT